MRIIKTSAIAWFVVAAMTTAAFGQAPIPPYPASQEVPARPKGLTVPQIPHSAVAQAPEEDYELMQEATSVATSPITSKVSAAVTPAVTALSPPVTITYTGSANAVTINDSGTGRGLSSSLTNTGNTNSAVYGEAKGAGAGVKGINSGVSGPGGSFSVNNATSAKAALTAATNGTGSALTASITRASSNQPAIIGTNTVTAGYGIGVEGTANYIGVYGLNAGTSGGYGMYGYASGGTGAAGLSSTGIGLLGESTGSYGVFGESTNNIGIYGYSVNSNGVYAFGYKADGVSANSTYGRAITAHSANSIGVYASSDLSYGVWGQSKNQFGVIGEDSGTGVGVYGSSASGYAGYFAGKVAATSYLTVSDRNKKTDFARVDGSQLLDRVSRLPITSWAFKDDRKLRHIGPMAQDFHAAFGLDGDDDTHISLSDAAGVSLAAIQELNKRLKEKDAHIAALEQQVKTMNETFEARLAKLEERVAPTAQIKTAY